MSVFRIYVEKKKPFTVEAQGILNFFASYRLKKCQSSESL